jgi:iron complex outermembrane receptor protein
MLCSLTDRVESETISPPKLGKEEYMIKDSTAGFRPQKMFVIFFTIILFLFSISLFAKGNKKKKKITEEIIVTVKAPQETPLAPSSLIGEAKVKTVVPKNLTELLNYSSGVYVSTGGKGESSVKIRGLSNKRTLLLFDGIPLYEPYFNSYSINLIPAEQIKEIKIIKGPSSVLYGPNTLGGVINVITKRIEKNYFSMNLQTAPEKTYYLAGSGGLIFNRFSFIGNMIYDKSDGFSYYENGEKKLRENSDYERKNFIGKLFYYPNENSEILTEVFWTKSNYGLPIATEIYKKRFWRFGDWERFQFNIGGSFNIFNTSSLKIRNYYIKHYNVLDAYKSSDYKNKKWSSTFNNYSLGSFLLSTFNLNDKNKLRFSLNLRKDNVKTQSDIGKPYKSVEQSLYSLGVEEHFKLSRKIKIIGGIGFDYLNKKTGENKSALNPIFGIKYNPVNYLEFNISYSNKTRFPAMKSLYSTKGGNPNLHTEIGKNLEFNFSYTKRFRFSGAFFYNKIDDMITSIRLASGYHQYQNIGKAEIKGLELEFGKNFSLFNISLNFTYLNTKNTDTGNKLDLIPDRQFNFMIDSRKYYGFTLSFWGVFASMSQTTFKDNILNIPSYSLLNFSLKKEVNGIIIYLKGENLLNKEYYTEPGYPMKGRTISFGIKIKIGEK